MHANLRTGASGLNNLILVWGDMAGGNASGIAQAAIPIALTAMTGGAAAPLAAGLSGALGAAVPTWLAGAGIGALTGALGSAITGQDPLQGALLGGAGGGIMNSGVFGAAADGARNAGTQAAMSAAPDAVGPVNMNNLPWLQDASMPSTIGEGIAGAASGIGDNISNLPSWAMPVGVGALSLAGAGEEEASAGAPIERKQRSNGAAQPMEREQIQVDPSVYYGAGGNRSFFNQINPPVQYAAKGGHIKQKFRRDVAGNGIGALVQGPGDGTSDDIPAMLSDGEYVIPAAAVSALGNGSNKAGAKKLDKMKKEILSRHYKKGALPKSSGIGSYMGAA